MDRWFTIPNGVTTLRIVVALIIPWIALTKTNPHWWPWHTTYQATVFYIAFATGTTDWIDGFLARTFNWKSNLGKWLDPLADKVYCAALILAVLLLKGPSWKYLWLFVPLTAYIVYYSYKKTIMYQSKEVLEADYPAKVKTFILICALLALLGDLAVESVGYDAMWQIFLEHAGLIALSVSAACCAYILWRRPRKTGVPA